MGAGDLKVFWNTVLRPTLEYAVPTFHPMLTAEMSDEIERVQKRASKLIYGFDSNYDRLVESGEIETLFSRREKLTLQFAQKACQSARFRGWFPETEYENMSLRSGRRYLEQYARTERMRRSPIYHTRRALNNNI